MFDIFSDVSGAILEDFIVWFGAFFSGHFCQNWKIYFSLKRPQIQKLWKRVLTNDELLEICHFGPNFLWANVQEIGSKFWPNRFGLVGSGQPTDLLFWLWTLQPICNELVISFGAKFKLSPGNPDHKITKSKTMLLGTGVPFQNWNIYFSLNRPQIEERWKRVLTNDELLDICHFEQNFQWANVQEIMGEIWPHRFGLVGSGQPTDLLFWLWTLQPICIELVIWFGAKFKLSPSYPDSNIT